MKSLLAGALSLLAGAVWAGELPGDFLIRPEDSRVVFLGDSITEQRMYTTYIEAYVLSRFPHWKVTFRNVGWRGDVVWMWMRNGLNSGLSRDVLPLSPKLVLVEYGMNDARTGEANVPKYVSGFLDLIQNLRAKDSRVILISPTPEEKYDEGEPGGSAYNNILAKFVTALQTVAEQEEVPFVDQFHPMLSAIDEGRQCGALGTTGAPRLTGDAVHPNWSGHLIMGLAILKGLHAPGEVSALTIDAQAGRVTSNAHCSAEIVSAQPLTFDRTDECLPMPVHANSLPALKIPSVASSLRALNDYRLTVVNLAAGSYIVKVDDIEVGTYSDRDLAQGINLAEISKGPIAGQCGELLSAIIKKNDLFYKRWRDVQLGKEFDAAEDKKQAELSRLDEETAKMEATIESLRVPKPHRFIVAPATGAR